AGPRAATAQTPGRITSTPGASSATAATTGSNARASRAGSGGSTTSRGQRDWASRRRRPRRTPSARAAGVVETTWLAKTTAAGIWSAPSGSTPAADIALRTGQSGQRTTTVRTGTGQPSTVELAGCCFRGCFGGGFGGGFGRVDAGRSRARTSAGMAGRRPAVGGGGAGCPPPTGAGRPAGTGGPAGRGLEPPSANTRPGGRPPTGRPPTGDVAWGSRWALVGDAVRAAGSRGRSAGDAVRAAGSRGRSAGDTVRKAGSGWALVGDA